MKVKLIRDGLYGTINRTAGEVLDLPDELARDVAARGDGLLVLKREAQVIPAFGAVELPSVYEDDEPEAASEPPAPEVPPASEPEVPAAPVPPAPVKPSPRAVLAK